MKRLAVAFALMMAAAPLAAKVAPGGSIRNLFASYYIYPPGSVITGADPVLDTSGRTQVSCGLVTGERTATLVFVGQSLSVNEVPTVRAIAQSRNHQINIYDGQCYQTKEPLLGVNVSGGAVTDARGTWMSVLADNLIAHGYVDRVVIVPMAVGSTTVAMWADDSTEPYLANNVGTVARRVRDAGLSCTAIHWGQGESDTSAGTSQTTYFASLSKVIALFNREMPGCPVIVDQESLYYGPVTSSAVTAAQSAAVNGTAVFAGANVDTIPTTERFDGVHLNETGRDHRAALVEAAIVAALGL